MLLFPALKHSSYFRSLATGILSQSFLFHLQTADASDIRLYFEERLPEWESVVVLLCRELETATNATTVTASGNLNQHIKRLPRNS
jgi:hypothetical protein